MKWKKFTLKTTTEAVDYISSLFDEIGIQGIEIEDNVPLTESETKGMFIDILPELPPDDGARSPLLRPRTRTGSTTGSSISSRLLWITSL